MEIKHFYLVVLIAFLIFPSITIMATAYKPGDTIHVTYNTHLNIATKPKFVRYTLFDPSDKVIYEEDHELTYVKQLDPFGMLWTWYDEYDVKVQSFSAPGTWRVEGRLFSEALWIIELPDLFPLKHEFEVEEVGFFENLIAPWYFTYDGGIMTGRISGSLPFHPLLLIIIIGGIVVGILIVKIFIDVAIPQNGVKRK